jgi:hypothetical protein
MNPKNKAKELLDRFAPLAKYWDCYNDEPLEENNAKLCALIAINEIYQLLEYKSDKEFWQSVKTEIEKF